MPAMVRTVQQLTPPRLTKRPLVRVVLAVSLSIAMLPEVEAGAVSTGQLPRRAGRLRAEAGTGDLVRPVQAVQVRVTEPAGGDTLGPVLTTELLQLAVQVQGGGDHHHQPNQETSTSHLLTTI